MRGKSRAESVRVGPPMVKSALSPGEPYPSRFSNLPPLSPATPARAPALAPAPALALALAARHESPALARAPRRSFATDNWIPRATPVELQIFPFRENFLAGAPLRGDIPSPLSSSTRRVSKYRPRKEGSLRGHRACSSSYSSFSSSSSSSALGEISFSLIRTSRRDARLDEIVLSMKTRAESASLADIDGPAFSRGRRVVRANTCRDNHTE